MIFTLHIPNRRQRIWDICYTKIPQDHQTFELNHGKAHIFYPEATSERCTVALLLDIDPVDLARGKKGSSGEVDCLIM